MSAFKNITGKRFGRLEVIEFAGMSKHKKALWFCRCDCSNEKIILGACLVRGTTVSCGCFHKERTLESHKIHGMSGINADALEFSTHAIWMGIINRCCNSNCDAFENYGGRGITVCDRWKNSFLNFLTDMGLRPSLTHSIDRIDVNGNYEPGNCRWATQDQQSRNKRTNRILSLDGKSQCLADWAKDIGISIACISNRLSRGWSVEDALTVPVRTEKFMTINGKTLNVSEWAKISNVSRDCIYERLNSGEKPGIEILRPSRRSCRQV